MSEVDLPGDRDFLSGSGEMGARMRAFDWAATPLGSPEGWPQNLKDAIAGHLSAAIVMEELSKRAAKAQARGGVRDPAAAGRPQSSGERAAAAARGS